MKPCFFCLCCFSVFDEFAIDGGFAGYLRAGCDVTTLQNNFLAAPKKHPGRTNPDMFWQGCFCFMVAQWNLTWVVFYVFLMFGKSTIDGGFAGYLRARCDVTTPQNNFLAAPKKRLGRASPDMFWQGCFWFMVSQWNFWFFYVFLCLEILR